MEPQKEKPTREGRQSDGTASPKDNTASALNPNFDDSIFTLDNPDTFKKHIAEIQSSFEDKTNPFPVEVFPVAVQNIIKQTNEALNFPVDFIGNSILFAASLAIGNTYKAEIMNNWVEGATLYLALVGRAGTNKSHPLTFALQPIFEHDKKTFSEYKEAKKVYSRAIMQAKNEQTEIPEKPFWKKYIVSDYTPESLAEVHRYNLRGVGVYADELAGWIKNFNRYNKGSEIEFWLTNFSGKQISIDRKNSDPVLIATPFIGVAGTIQNRILTELGKDDRNQNGFIDRILFSIPENLQKEYWSETSLNPAIIQSWAQIVNNLLSLPLNFDETGNPQPAIMGFSTEAKEVLKQWQRENADLCNQPENEPLAGIFSKLEIYVIRFALILELMDWAAGEPANFAINAKIAKNATILIEYFRINAIYVNKYISNNNTPMEILAIDKQALYQALPKVFENNEGLTIAQKLNFPDRSYQRFLKESQYFKKLSFGKYEKIL